MTVKERDDECKELRIQVKFGSEFNRKESFTAWVFSDNQKCSASKLAEAGFYFIGSKTEPDAVQCFLCGKSLDGWEEDDDPWQEHKKHSQNCKFAKLGKPECKLTVNQFLDIQMEVVKNWIIKRYENQKMELVIKQKMLSKLCKS
ncbi:deterin [Holotrichia oblita]|uniref:Deterin n=1 Tax=Holotrichia oblita TaxID=644536 RepID=A0ACB9TDK2_HOLOL|nr:deterin [Holotrichia oblita]